MTVHIKRVTVNARISRGWSREDAENTPLLVNRVLTIEKVLELEPEGLSINSAAYIFGILPQTLWNFLDRHGLPWRGRQVCRKKGEKEQTSCKQKLINENVKESTVYAQMSRNGLSFNDALEKVKHLKKTRVYLTQEQTDYIMNNYKKLGRKSVAEHLGLTPRQVQSKHNYMKYIERQKENKNAIH